MSGLLVEFIRDLFVAWLEVLLDQRMHAISRWSAFASLGAVL